MYVGDSEQNQDSNVESTDENTFITLSELQQQRATKEGMLGNKTLQY